MSTSQEIAELAAKLPEEDWDLLDKAVVLLERYDPDAAADALRWALFELDLDTEHVLELVDNLERALARYHRPLLEESQAFKTDMKRFFQYMRGFLKDYEYLAAQEIMGFYEGMFAPAGKKVCGSLIKQCRATIDGENCRTPYAGPGIMYCPKCGVARRFCNRTPIASGRCGVHGGKHIVGAFRDGKKASGRLKVYGEMLNGQLREMYIEAVTDENYLSVAPEIAALAARNAQLMSQMGDTDYMVIAAGMGRAVAEIESALAEDNFARIHLATIDIKELMGSAIDDYRRWDEFGKITTRIGRLTDAERKRIVDAQQSISVQEMYMLQQEMLVGIRDAATAAANYIWTLALNGKLENSSPVRIRNEFLREMQGQMAGKKGPKLIEADIVDEEE